MKKTFYIATKKMEWILPLVRQYGIIADPELKMVPLCSSIEGAITCLLLGEYNRDNSIDIKDIKKVYYFDVDLPDDTTLFCLSTPEPELQGYEFIGYPGDISPEYITGYGIVGLKF